jgi:NADH:ubiquinone oxidoreductase subunit 2 (subunit N)
MFWLSSELILFLGIFSLLITLGLYIKKVASTAHLLRILTRQFQILSLLALIGVSLSIALMHAGLDGINWFQGIVFSGDSYRINFFTQMMKFILLLINLFFANIFAITLQTRRLSIASELPILLHLAVLLSFVMVSTENFVPLLLALEGFSLILYVMTVIERTHGGVMAAVKYFAFGTLGSIFLFWGVVQLYRVIPSLSYKVLFFTAEYISLVPFSNSADIVNSFDFAGTLITVGFLVKLGAAPMHQ